MHLTYNECIISFSLYNIYACVPWIKVFALSSYKKAKLNIFYTPTSSIIILKIRNDITCKCILHVKRGDKTSTQQPCVTESNYQYRGV